MKRERLFIGRGFLCEAQKRAFTMIELLLVVALMVVMAGLAIPNFSKHFSSLGFDQTTKHVSYLMRYAQSLAIVHQKEYQICFSSDYAQYWLEEESLLQDTSAPQPVLKKDAGTGFQKVAGEKGRVFFVPSGISVEAEKTAIRFYPDGTIDRMRIIFKSANRKEIVVSTQERRGQIDVFSSAEQIQSPQ